VIEKDFEDKENRREEINRMENLENRYEKEYEKIP